MKFSFVQIHRSINIYSLKSVASFLFRVVVPFSTDRMTFFSLKTKHKKTQICMTFVSREVYWINSQPNMHCLLSCIFIETGTQYSATYHTDGTKKSHQMITASARKSNFEKKVNFNLNNYRYNSFLITGRFAVLWRAHFEQRTLGR